MLLRETLVLEEEWEEKRHAAGQGRADSRQADLLAEARDKEASRPSLRS